MRNILIITITIYFTLFQQASAGDCLEADYFVATQEISKPLNDLLRANTSVTKGLTNAALGYAKDMLPISEVPTPKVIGKSIFWHVASIPLAPIKGTIDSIKAIWRYDAVTGKAEVYSFKEGGRTLDIVVVEGRKTLRDKVSEGLNKIRNSSNHLKSTSFGRRTAWEKVCIAAACTITVAGSLAAVATIPHANESIAMMTGAIGSGFVAANGLSYIGNAKSSPVTSARANQVLDQMRATNNKISGENSHSVATLIVDNIEGFQFATKNRNDIEVRTLRDLASKLTPEQKAEVKEKLEKKWPQVDLFAMFRRKAESPDGGVE